MPTPAHRSAPTVQDQPYVEVFTEIGAIEHYLRAAVAIESPRIPLSVGRGKETSG